MSEAFGGAEFILPPIPEHAVPARPVLLDLRRRDLQSDVLARPQAGNPASARRLQVPSAASGMAISRSGGATPMRISRNASMEGGDVMPVGKGVVLIGMGERTTHQAVGQVARELFRNKAATRVIGCLMPKSRAAMHLDTVFSFCDRDLVTLFRRRRRSDPLLQHLSARTTMAASKCVVTNSRCSRSSRTRLG